MLAGDQHSLTSILERDEKFDELLAWLVCQNASYERKTRWPERGPLDDFLVQKVKSKRNTVHLQTVH